MDVVRYRWNGQELIDVTGSASIGLYVADSFLVSDGAVVDINAHLNRFSDSAQHQGLLRPIEAFLDAVLAQLPRKGMIFPRIELTERGELELRIRDAPALTSTLTVSTAGSDPRTTPEIKGPDIPALADLQESAKALGADDAVIVNTSGQIIDGTTTCLVWVDGEKVYQPPHEFLRVSSVTVAQLEKIVGQPLSEQSRTPTELDGCELYALNSLHGIRAVTSWINGPTLEVNPDRLETWRAAYQNLFTALPESA